MDIYVGNLPYDVSDDELRQMFESYGAVASARVIMDRAAGRSKGFGFVEMPDRAEAEKAIEAMNGSEVGGRALRVNESKPRPKNDNRGGGGRGRW
ncbi:MAG TPA: RNA-binding protein [bacterium]|nr:RNA-binding protein [bacterium]HPJ71553.1 RNA-binding protein [bacterium]HPQ65841.1 RNA-binding protein [bacterium]